eukprot:9683069-Alexandrium_andersonii.AAC.1
MRGPATRALLSAERCPCGTVLLTAAVGARPNAQNGTQISSHGVAASEQATGGGRSEPLRQWAPRMGR